MEILIGLTMLLFLLVPVILSVISIIKANTLERRINSLEQQIALRGKPVGQVSSQESQPQRAHVPAEVTMPSLELSSNSPEIPHMPPAPRAPRRSQQEWEQLVGTTWLNRIGAFALILAVGFFLKYAFDRNWITESLRVLIGGAAGIVCLVVAARTRNKGYQIFAQGLVGSGISILYLSVYASFSFYHLLPQWAAFLLMSVVTIIGLVKAFSYDSLAVSLLSWAGGFLTPVLLSTGISNEIALFTYVSLLSLGLLGIVVKKESWIALEPLTLGALYSTYFAWFDTYYTESDLTLTIFFLAVFFLLFFGLDLVRLRFQIKRYKELRHVVQALSPLLFYIALFMVVDKPHHGIMGVVTLLFGLFYAGTLIGLKRFWRVEQSVEVRYSVTAIAFLAIAAAVEYGDYATVRLWSLEALLVLYLAIRFEWKHFFLSACLLFGAAIENLLFSEDALRFGSAKDFVFLFSDRSLMYATVAASLGVGTFFLKNSTFAFKETARGWLGVAFFMSIFVFLTVETNDYFRHLIAALRESSPGGSISDQIMSLENQRQLSTSAVWLVYSIVVMLIGILASARGPRFVAMGLFGLSILKIFLFDLSFLETLYRIFSFLALGLILLAVSYLYQRYKSVLFPQEEKLESAP